MSICIYAYQSDGEGFGSCWRCELSGEMISTGCEGEECDQFEEDE